MLQSNGNGNKAVVPKDAATALTGTAFTASRVALPLNQSPMKQDLITLSEQLPGLTVQVSLEDLLQAGRVIKEELLQELNLTAQEGRPASAEEFLSREETMKKLKISSATLWRWKKCGYLIPVQLGSMDRYRLSDINDILIKKGGAL